MAFLKLTKLGLFLMLLGIIFQRRVVDTVKDLPPSDSRLNRGQTRFSLYISQTGKNSACGEVSVN